MSPPCIPSSAVRSADVAIEKEINKIMMEAWNLFPYVQSTTLEHGTKIWIRESNARLRSYDVHNIKREK